MKAALIQMRNVPEKQENLDRAARLIREAAENGAELCVLPEMFCCEYRNRAFIENQEPAGGPAWQMLSRAARENRVWLIGGTIPESDGGKIYNSSFVFDREGRQAARCRKSHLFDIDVEGGQRFKESDTFTAGDQICVFDTEFGRFGLCICFDMRFPELARIMSQDGAWAVFCPASFNMTTGPAHWEVMFRSRAVESQVYTLGCAPRERRAGQLCLLRQLHRRLALGRRHSPCGRGGDDAHGRAGQGLRGQHTPSAAAHVRTQNGHLQT